MAHFDADGAYLAGLSPLPVDPDADGIFVAGGLYAVACQEFDDGVFEYLDVLFYAEMVASEVDDGIYHQLSGAVIGDVPSPLDAYTFGAEASEVLLGG